MSCERFEEMMVDSLYGELDAAAETTLGEHLAQCTACRAEFEALQATLSAMNRRERPDPGRAYWDGYWDRLSARMQDERVVSPATTPSWWRQRVGSPGRWAYRVAAAAAILAVGVFAGRTFFAPQAPVNVTPPATVADKTDPRPSVPPVEDTGTQVAEKGDGTASTARPEAGPETPPASGNGDSTPAMDVVPASSDRARRYIEKSQMLLVALVNNDPSTPDGYAAGLGVQQKRSRALVDEAATIREDLKDPRQRQLRELVTELEKILLQIANLESEEDMDAVEFIRSRVNEHDVLFKINLEQMRHGTDVDGSAGEAQRSNSQRSI